MGHFELQRWIRDNNLDVLRKGRALAGLLAQAEGKLAQGEDDSALYDLNCAKQYANDLLCRITYAHKELDTEMKMARADSPASV